MKISIIAVGKLKEKYLKDGIAEYAKRLGRFCTLELMEVSDEQAPENLSQAQEQQIKEKEAARILSKVKDGSVLVVLDIKGQRFTSEVFAAKLEGYMNSGKSHITFVIGGSLGLDEKVTEAADLKLSFSNMTFPHQLMRLILAEQVYRAFKIMNGETYHK